MVDGYDKDGLYHLNWGWGGSCDNYFLLSILDPDSNDGIGASTSTDGYSFSQEAVIGTRPNTGEPFDDMRMSLGSISFEIYMIHAIVKRVAQSVAMNAGIESDSANLCMAVVIILATIALAYPVKIIFVDKIYRKASNFRYIDKNAEK